MGVARLVVADSEVLAQSSEESADEDDPSSDIPRVEPSGRAWADTGLGLSTAFEAERRLIRQKFEARAGCGARAPSGSEPFAVAFSGGGVRAAAFQAGVLWRLAQAERLHSVEHFVAVSGGAYITSAFCSHLVAEGQPADGEELHAWYRRITAKTICRMQRNIGYFVRDWSLTGPFTRPKDGSGLCPPIVDLPMLLVVIVCTILSNPLTHFVVYLVPLAECLNFFMGTAMRAAYCAPTNAQSWFIFEFWGQLHTWMWNLVALVLVTFVAWVLGSLPICWRKRAGLDGGAPLGLYLQSFRAATTRILVVLALIIFVLGVSMGSELYDDTRLHTANQTRRDFCRDFVLHHGRHPAMPPQAPRCGDMRVDAHGHWTPWWHDHMFDIYRRNATAGVHANVTAHDQSATARLLSGRKRQKAESVLIEILGLPFALQRHFAGSSLFVSLCLVMSVMFGISFVLTPIFKGLFIFCLSLAGPTAVLFFSASFIQYRIFGPLTGQYYARILALGPFDQETYSSFHMWCLVLAFFLMVFFHPVHFASHYFYTRCLRLAYFDNGRDVTWKQLQENPYCPLVILTGTVTDWKRPGDEEGISEISISSLHTGSSKTGFVETPPWRSVAKCTAIAAAATDAFILGMLDRMRYRFWLEFLNLRMGDYILFERFRNPCVRWCQKRRPMCVARRESFVFYEFPLVVLGGTAYLVWILASFISHSSHEDDCEFAHSLYVFSSYMVMAIIFLSFFGFVPCLEFFVHSPMMRQIHMAMRYYHVSEHAPSMMFVSDGGVQDCTGIHQLMRRRCGRILLALAAADPNDDMAVLRETMRLAVEMKIGSFYDPANPRRDVFMLLDEFKQDKSKTYLHIGIYYGWDEEKDEECSDEESSAHGDGATTDRSGRPQRRTGHLFVVKNRLPPEDGESPVEPLLEEEEIVRAAKRSREPWGSPNSGMVSMGGFSFDTGRTLEQRELGGCCCDCCHVLGCNCGPKFPHTTNANQCLTPSLFSSLCRLGYRLSEDAIDAMAKCADVE